MSRQQNENINKYKNICDTYTKLFELCERNRNTEINQEIEHYCFVIQNLYKNCLDYRIKKLK